MPTSWKRSPEELHRVYIENTEAFYRVAGRAAARELDGFMQSCALALWARAGSVTQAQVDAINQLYSKGRSKGTRLLWELTGEVCRSGEVLPPMFFWSLAERDAREGRDCSRVFVRMVTNILLHLAAVHHGQKLAVGHLQHLPLQHGREQEHIEEHQHNECQHVIKDQRFFRR